MIGKSYSYSFILATPEKSVTSLGNILAFIVTVMCLTKGSVTSSESGFGAGPCNLEL